MKTLITTILFIILFPLSAQANGGNAQSHARVEAETPAIAKDWLRNQAKAVLMLDRINLAHIQGLKDCACHEQYKSGERLSPQCDPRTAAVEPAFIRTIVTMWGETHSLAAVSCSVILQRMIYSRLENDWPELRRAMALMKPEKFHNASVAEVFSNGFGERTEPVPHLEYKINPRPQHLIRGLPWHDAVVIRPQAPLTPAEAKTFMAEYTEFSAEACQKEFAERSCKANQPAMFYDRTMSVEAKCNKIIYGRNEEGIRYRIAFGKSIDTMNIRRYGEFHKNHQIQYADLIQRNPLLVMVSSPRPGKAELIKALHTISGNARKRYEATQTSLAQSHDLERYAGRYHVLSYSEPIWTNAGKSAADFEKWREFYVKKYTQRQEAESLMEVGALVGISVACMVPWGRTLAPAMAVMKVGCLAALGIPMNAYFMLDSFLDYNRDFRNFFSSLEFSQPFFEKGLDQLASDRDNVIFTALFMPLGFTQLRLRALAKAYAKALGTAAP